MGAEDGKQLTKKKVVKGKKGKGKKGKGKKAGKKKAKGPKKDFKRLGFITKAWAYGAQQDMIDLERDTKVMSSATIEEVKAIQRALKSQEKILSTNEGRHAEDWAAGPLAIKDKDAQMLFTALDAKGRGKIDLKSFLDKAVSSAKVKPRDNKKTEKQKAEEKRLVQYEELDWTSKDAVISTWPLYIQKQIELSRAKRVPKIIDVEYFNLKIPFSSDYLLKDCELKVGLRKRLTLVGEPGSGKSTLFRAMASAEIKGFPENLSVHHMIELEVSPDAESLIDTVVNSHPFLRALRLNKAEINRRINGEAPHDAPTDEAKSAMKENLKMVEVKLKENGHARAEENASKSLRVLGFDNTAQTKSINSLSGGLRMRVALCAAFFIEADVLLLDEPTNHLDFPSLLWLENRLRTYRKTLVMVCHDREILNNVSSGVILITEEKSLKYYDMPFEAYEKTRWAAEAKMARDVEKFLKRHRNIDFSSPLAVQAARKRKWLDAYCRKMVLRAGQFTFPVPIDLEPDNEQKGMDIAQKDVSVIKVTDVRFSYDPETLPFIFDTPISIDITMSSRMGVMGPNGAGKSTFLKLLTSRLHPVDGTITTNKHAIVAYFSQHHAAEMDMTDTPLMFMQKKFPEEKVGNLKSHLAKVGCTGDEIHIRLNDHSQGMRSCVLFSGLTYTCPNLLIMDEPTNFLDIETVDALINATNKYGGALLLVSHSRLFLKKCATAYLSIVPGSFDIYPTLDECERATYSFINEMENGDKVRIGEGNLATSAGSNSKDTIANKGQEDLADDDGILVF